MHVAEEEIFAVSYSIVKLLYGFSRSPLSITKTPVIGRPKRAKAYHLAFGDDDDSDEEIEVSSDEDEDGDGNDNTARKKGVKIQFGNDVISIEEEEECSSAAKNKSVLIWSEQDFNLWL